MLYKNFAQGLMWCLTALLAGACATPSQRVNSLAQEFGFERFVVPGTRFEHLVFFNRAALDTANSSILHVYLEGDGSPWIRRRHVAKDPTPRNPLALKLMSMDNAPSVYIGRPCYYRLKRSAECNPLLWTHQRYSRIVVDSMVAATASVIKQIKTNEITLIGYSGGGVLAMLMAENISQTAGLVTVAANLDIDAWARYHQYSELVGSLNPALRAPLSTTIKQWHFAGKQDQNVPLSIIQSVATKQGPQANLKVLESFDHICCWLQQWPQILSGIH